jgi:hypothetical protein
MAKDNLYPLYNVVVNLQSYKEFEAIDFSDIISHPIDRDALNKYLLIDFLRDPSFKRYLRKK